MPVVIHQIELKLNSPTQLSYPQTIGVYQNEYVQWKIKDGEKLNWFAIVGKNGTHPFIILRNGHWIKLTAHVRNDAPVGIWDYKILYVIQGTHTVHVLDPKIAVKSKPAAALIWIIGIPLMIALIAYRTVSYFRKVKAR